MGFLLQPYRMRTKAIPERENIGADYLSSTEYVFFN